LYIFFCLLQDSLLVKLLQRLTRKKIDFKILSRFFFHEVMVGAATVQNIVFFFEVQSFLWSKHHSSLSRGEVLFFLWIFGKIYNKMCSFCILFLQKRLEK